MLKKLFITAALTALALVGVAQVTSETIWTFEGSEWSSYQTDNNIDVNATVNNLTVNGKWRFVTGSTTFEGSTYTYALQDRGGKTISVNVGSAGIISWVAATDKSGRTVKVSLDGIEVASTTPGSTVARYSQDISGAGTVTLTSSGNEVNFYEVKWTPAVTGLSVSLSTIEGDLGLNDNITATFSGAVTNPAVTVTDADGATVDATIAAAETVENTYTISFTKAYGKTYTVKVTGTVDGTSVESSATYTTLTPALTFTPATGATDMTLDADITLAFNVALQAAPTVTVKAGETTVTSSVVAGENYNYTVSFEKAYATTYTVSVSATAEDGTSISGEATYTTVAEVATIDLQQTTVTTTWTSAGSQVVTNNTTVVDGTLAVVDGVFANNQIQLYKISESTNTPGYMYFSIPAGVEGRLIVDATANNRPVYVMVRDATQPQTVTELTKAIKSDAANIGNATNEGATLEYTVLVRSADSYVYIYNDGGRVNYNSITWSLENYYITETTPTGSAVALGSAIVVAYNAAVNTPTITVNGVEATVVASADNKTFTVAGAAADYATTYEVVVAATTTQVAEGETAEQVEGTSWSFTTVAKPKTLTIAGYTVTSLPADPATEKVNVYVPYYSTINYQDSAEVVNSIVTDGYTLGAFSVARNLFNTEYKINLDGTDYTFVMHREYLKATNVKLGNDTAYAFYLMPTQDMVAGSETYAMTLVADVTTEAELSAVPSLTGTFTWENATSTTITSTMNVGKPVYDENAQKQGCKYSEGEITFNYDGKDVKIKYILSLVPAVGNYRAVWFEEIPAEMYIPNKGDDVVFRGLTIHPATGTPKNPVRVTYFDINDPSKKFSLDGYTIHKTLKMGGRVNGGTDAGKRQGRYLTVNNVQGSTATHGQGAEVVTMLVSNGSNDRESSFQMQSMSAAGEAQHTSGTRALPRGGSAWWSYRSEYGASYIDMYGFDPGTNIDGTATDGQGGNVQYIFLEIAPGVDFTATGLSVEPQMSTVSVGSATRVLAASGSDQITVRITYPKEKAGFEHYRQSLLNLRKVGTISDAGADMTTANKAVAAYAKGDTIDVTHEGYINLDVVSEKDTIIDNNTVLTVVLKPQQALEGNTQYELWTSDAAFILPLQDVGSANTNPVSYATPLYIIYTVEDYVYNYRFENNPTAKDRVYPSNVYTRDAASVAVLPADKNLYNTGDDNEGYILEVKGVDAATSVTVGFDTPDDYPGNQEEVSVGDDASNAGYCQISFDVYVPADETAATSRAAINVSLSDANGNTIQLADETKLVDNTNITGMLVPAEGSLLDAHSVAQGSWTYRVSAYSQVVGAWLAPFADNSRRIYVTIDGTNLAYIDNVMFRKVETVEYPTAINTVNSNKNVYFNGREVVNTTNNRVEVYSIAGVKVLDQAGNADLSRLTRGIYIVRCGDQVLKIRK